MSKATATKYQAFRVNCEGDTITGRFLAVSKSDAARGFAKALRVRDGNTIRVWTTEEHAAKADPTTFWVEHVR